MKFCTEEELTKMSHDDRIAYYNQKRDYEDDQRKQNMQNLLFNGRIRSPVWRLPVRAFTDSATEA